MSPRPFDVIDVEQHTDAWRQARCGRLTGSCAHAMLTTLKSGEEAAARRDLRLRLVCERLTGRPQENDYVGWDMRRGIALEPTARALYEARTAALVRAVGFVAPRSALVGYSPDGVIGDFAGLIEVKCPRAATHLDYVRTREVPKPYLNQIRHGLWLTNAEFADFISYNADFPPPLDLFVTRVTMTDAERKAYTLVVGLFLGEVQRDLDLVRGLLATPDPAPDPEETHATGAPGEAPPSRLPLRLAHQRSGPTDVRAAAQSRSGPSH